MGSAAADDAGWLRIAHLSPDTPAADVTVVPAGSTGPAPATEAGLHYGSVSAWHRVAPGAYAVAVRAAGAAASTGPVLSARVDVGPGAARTVALTGRFAALRLTVQDEDLSPPAPGRARVRVVDAASTGPVGVSVAGGPSLASALQPGTWGAPTELTGGPASLQVSAAGGPPDSVAVDLPPGSVTTLLVLDRADGGLTVQPVLDAGGPAAAPVGPVQAGEGGTAPRFPLRLVAAVTAGIAGSLLVFSFRPGRRRT